MSSALDLSPEAFASRLAERGRRRAWLRTNPETGRLEASDSWLAETAEAVAALPDWQGHEALFFEVGRESGCLFGVAVHSTVRGQALGGVRHTPYVTFGALVRDGLRLAAGMTRKSALAGLWWGGGKGVIARAAGTAPQDPRFRRMLYREFGRFVSSLGGCYVTAEDAGTTPADLAAVHETTRFATCVPPEVGGSGNPSLYTAAGVVCALDAAVEFAGLGGLAGRCVAMQGAGNVGVATLERLLERGVKQVRVAELDPARRRAVAERFAGAPLEVAPATRDDPLGILTEPCDVLMPNAFGGVLGPDSIPEVRARIVCGAANNQLVDEARDGEALRARGVLFVPEIIANRMGVVHCANEQYGVMASDPAVERHLSEDWEHAIAPTVRRVLSRAQKQEISPVAAANALAAELAKEPHPLWPGRGCTLVGALVRARWHEQG